MEFYTRQEVAAMLKCSLPTVAQIFERPDFPSLDFGKSKLVKKEAFEEWSSRRHSKDDYGLTTKK